MAKVIAVTNQKGGVGKSTLTRELSAMCAIRGYRVLSIDCDPQGSLTASWLDTEKCEPNLVHCFIAPEGALKDERWLDMSPLAWGLMLLHEDVPRRVSFELEGGL